MAIEGCVGYTRGCPCPGCRKRRRKREYRIAEVEQQAVYCRAERHAHQQASAAEAGHRGLSGAVVPIADYPRLVEHEWSRIKQLQGQITALRELAAQHSPGADSAGLVWQQAQQLAGLLEQHRNELRVLLNGDATFDTPDDDPQPGSRLLTKNVEKS